MAIKSPMIYVINIIVIGIAKLGNLLVNKRGKRTPINHINL